MLGITFTDWTIAPLKDGATHYAKVSYPLRYGRYGEIDTPDCTCQFNLNGEVKFLRGKSADWPSPTEWLKRTAGNDWVYYSGGDYREIFDATGEFYLPCPSYPSNAVSGPDPFRLPAVRAAMASWEALPERASRVPGHLADPAQRAFLDLVARQGPDRLRDRADRLHGLLGGPVSVLPPDARHADYDVIPLAVADGCLYNCGFCTVKSGVRFTVRSEANVLEQIDGLRDLYGRDLVNYNALFLGFHDALQAGGERVEFAARKALEALALDRSLLREPRLFLFGSADSFLRARDSLFRSLCKLPFMTYMNIGLESADPDTLQYLEKPLTVDKVTRAFQRMVEVNRRFEKIEVTANFVFGEELPAGHLPALVGLAQKTLENPYPKGAIYLSPLLGKGTHPERSRRDTLKTFREMKLRTRLPTYLYVIQRL